MGGHSHWAGIKHKKALVDAKKGKVFTKIIREITIAAKLGGADLNSNARLRKAVDDAKNANMPADNVKRAIMKGTGQIPGTVYEEITYEGYGPGSVAVIVECTTDNKNRTFSEIRKKFTDKGGNTGTPGSVAYMFAKKGLILVDKTAVSEEDLMNIALEAGAEDIKTQAEGYEIITPVEAFEAVKTAVEAKGIKPVSAELSMLPSNEVEIKDVETASKILAMIENLEEHDDVKEVYSNYSIPDDILAKIESK
ncbi:MAG: YebC/PmpR family DNA-binding transcriptional regulator [Elusimicrobiota bacterium]|jgi:YebC/PmpR family DNA-binding regulatory protein|nr:YebC/PmpR family DNA-binding transcriptional regulator [Elusimicrobiota bacterium]